MSGLVAERGPAPKRSQARRRRNKTGEDGESIEVDHVELDLPPVDDSYRKLPNEGWRPAAKAVWQAAMDSGATVFWEPSDYVVLAMTCSEIDKEYADDLIIEKVKLPMENGSGGGEELIYGSRPMPAAKFGAILKALGSLGFTELDRRRMRMELERHGTPVDEGSTEELETDRLTLLQGGRSDVG